MMTTSLDSETSCASSRTTKRRTRCVTVQNSSKMVAALSSADIELTAMAAVCAPPPKMVTKNRAVSMNIGLPGGCPTSSLKPCEMNSGQSQKLAVGSIVSR